MNNIFRGLIAGYGAKKLGGGCFGTIVVFIIIWVALGQCSWTSEATPAPETYPADRRVQAPVYELDNEGSSPWSDYFISETAAVHLKACA